MTAPRDLLPMAMLALATLVGVGVVVALGELLRRTILFALSAIFPAAPEPSGPGEKPERRRGRPERS